MQLNRVPLLQGLSQVSAGAVILPEGLSGEQSSFTRTAVQRVPSFLCLMGLLVGLLTTQKLTSIRVREGVKDRSQVSLKFNLGNDMSSLLLCSMVRNDSLALRDRELNKAWEGISGGRDYWGPFRGYLPLLLNSSLIFQDIDL